MSDDGMDLPTELRFASALEKIAQATLTQAESNAKLAETFVEMGKSMEQMTRTIQGAQRKIGGEMGHVIDKSKLTLGKLNEELEAARRANAKS
jgi:hypothetical protein